LGDPPTLLFANRVDIREVGVKYLDEVIYSHVETKKTIFFKLSLNNNKYTAILKGLENAIALDYHFEQQIIFWTDVSQDIIKRASIINGSEKIGK